VTGVASAAPAADPQLQAAASTYRAYVRRQADDLLARTRDWVTVLKSGDAAAAKAGFAATRAPFERIEPVAESFPDLDQRIDARDTDLDPGAAWTGFHRLEKDLWRGTRPDRVVADGLLADVTALHRRLTTQTFTALDLANGAKSLLDELATKKVTGEEDHFSHTDLSDFAANLEGSKAALDALRPVLDRRDPGLGRALDTQFATAEAAVRRYRNPAGDFVSYTTLGTAQVKELSDSINALGEPVSRVAAVISGR
jgi:iron uptake system component EfeO